MKKVANVVLNDFINDSRVLKTTRSLLEFGYQSIVVAKHNRGLKELETLDGDVRIHRIRLVTRMWPKWKPIQILKYIEFTIKAFIAYRKYDIIHCNDLEALPIGVLIKFSGKGKKIVYDCHEHEAEVNGLKGVEKVARRWLEKALIRYADVVITVSDSIAKDYSRLYNIPEPLLVMNCPPFQEKEKLNLFREAFSIRSDQFIFLYQGVLGKGRGIELLLEAFSGQSCDKNVLVFMGYGPLEERIKSHVEREKLVFFHPAVSPDALLNYTGSADYGVAFIEDVSLSDRYCLPNKLFEYLMAGLPVLTSDLPEMKRFVETEEVGVVAERNSVVGLKKALQITMDSCYERLQKNVISVRRKYSWEAQEHNLYRAYQSLIDH